MQQRNNAEYIEFAGLVSARLQKIWTLRCCGLEKEGEYDTTARMGNPECEQIFLRELKPGGLPNLMKYSEI